MQAENIILVNTNDDEVGSAEKLVAHQQGLMHRAFSVLLFAPTGKWVLQQRAKTKYHSGGLWTNACCSHPKVGEKTNEAVKRRLMEELKIDSNNAKFVYKFHYKIELDNGLIENELDHVYRLTTDQKPQLVPDEAMDYKQLSTDQLKAEIESNPEQFTYWFKLIFKNYLSLIKQ